MPDFVGYEAENITKADQDLLRGARERLEAAKNFRRKDREETWKRNELQYVGHHWPQASLEDPAADLITVNMSFSTINTIIPFVTAEEPRFLVEPYSTDAKVSNARLQQAWLNRYWRSQERGAQEALEIASTDMLMYGDGYLKATHQFKDKQTGPTTYAEIVEIYTDRVSPWDVWIDPNATSFATARYIIQRFYLTREEMEGDEERYGDVDLDALPWGNVAFDESDSDFNHEERIAGEANYMKVYEYYDIVTETLLVFAEGDDTPLLRKVEGILPPIVQLANFYKPRSPYHISELEMIHELQEELNKARSELSTHRRRNIAKYAIRNDVITNEAIDALTSPIVGQAVPIQTDAPLSDVFAPIQTATLPPEAYSSADQAVRDIYEITGVSEYLRGAAPEIRRTATEASIIEGASNVKVQAKLRKIERAARALGAMILAIAKDTFPETDADEMGLFLTGDEAQRALRAQQGEEIADQIGQGAGPAELAATDLSLAPNVELRPTEDMFVGEYEVFVETASTELRNPVFKEQKMREMALELTNAAPTLQQMGINLNLRKVYEKWFEAAGISDIEGMFDGAPAAPPQLPFEIPGAQGPAGLPPGLGMPNLQGAVPPPPDGITEETSGVLPPTA